MKHIISLLILVVMPMIAVADDVYMENGEAYSNYNPKHVVNLGVWSLGKVHSPDSIYYVETADYSVIWREKYLGSAYLTLEGRDNNVLRFAINNETPDTLYFFDSYLHNCINPYSGYFSDFLHRYDEKAKKSRVSLLPMHFFMGTYRWKKTRLLRTLNKGIDFRANEYVYHFSVVKPFSKLIFKIPQSVFEHANYVIDSYPETWKTKPMNMYVKEFTDTYFRPYHNKEIRRVYLEIALYNSIDWCDYIDEEFSPKFLLPRPQEYSDDWEGFNYTTLSIPVILEDVIKKQYGETE